jgi:hypothetical protein
MIKNVGLAAENISDLIQETNSMQQSTSKHNDYNSFNLQSYRSSKLFSSKQFKIFLSTIKTDDL